jgi:hypothetical protein
MAISMSGRCPSTRYRTGHLDCLSGGAKLATRRVDVGTAVASDRGVDLEVAEMVTKSTNSLRRGAPGRVSWCRVERDEVDVGAKPSADRGQLDDILRSIVDAVDERPFE